jgi:hypothetical protein
VGTAPWQLLLHAGTWSWDASVQGADLPVRHNPHLSTSKALTKD